MHAYSQKTFYVNINSQSEITCGDSVQLLAELVSPVSIKVISAGYYPDGIGLQVLDKNNKVIINDLYIWVELNKTVDSTIFLKSGDYILKWSYGGADLLNPIISGSVGGWKLVDNVPQIEFQVDTLVDSDNVTFNWLDAGSDMNSIKIAPDKTNTYTVIATYQDGSIAKDSMEVKVDPLTISAENISVSCGNTAQLNISTNYTGSGNLSYTWNPSIGLSATNIANPIATLKSAAEYFVEVVTTNGCMSKDTVNLNTSVISYDPSICFVTVDENNKNVIVWKDEVNAAIDSFLIYKESSNQTDQYDMIGTLPYNSTNIFVDTSSNARVQSNKYKIAIKDICGFLTLKSSEHKTMHLTINKGIGNNWNLIWEEYIGVPISGYRIYRGTSRSDLALIGTASGGNTTYTDESAPVGDVYYQLEVILPVDCSLLKGASQTCSRSNIISNIDVITGLTDNFTSKSFVFPNPAKDELYIKNVFYSNTDIFIYDINGNLVLSQHVESYPINISQLAKGLYTTKLINPAGVSIAKFIKE
jgi:hypothetical protein